MSDYFMRAIFVSLINSEMLISRNWIQKYFDKPLPSAEEIARLFTFHAFEIEGIEEKNGDAVLDVKVLPDRANYALSHRAIAGELAVLLGISVSDKTSPAVTEISDKVPEIRNDAKQLMHRYSARIIENIDNASKDKEVGQALEIIGQRSINKIVDAINYVMYDIGQPMHAFDLDKLNGPVVARMAENGEMLVVLGGNKIILDGTELVMADDNGPLDLAGVKGGERAAITSGTRSIFLLSTNIDPKRIRRTAAKYALRSDASKRFENGVSQTLTVEAMERLTGLLAKGNVEVRASAVVDIESRTIESKTIELDSKLIDGYLGEKVPADESTRILKALGCDVEVNDDIFFVNPPLARADLNIPADLVEEIGRVRGYDRVPVILPPPNLQSLHISKKTYYEKQIRDFFAEAGFSEIFTSSFANTGDRQIEKSLASDKNFLRINLTENLKDALDRNKNNAPLFAADAIQVFEIGNAFPAEREYTALAAGIALAVKRKGKKANDLIRDVRDELLKYLNAEVSVVCTLDDSGGIILLGGEPIGKINHIDGIMELNLGKLIGALPEPKAVNFGVSRESRVTFKPFSLFPFIARDIALFVPGATMPDEVKEVLETSAGSLLHSVYIFDEFENEIDGVRKKSLAFRIIFQTMETTLEDMEANDAMDVIYAKVKEKGWEVR